MHQDHSDQDSADHLDLQQAGRSGHQAPDRLAEHRYLSTAVVPHQGHQGLVPSDLHLHQAPDPVVLSAHRVPADRTDRHYLVMPDYLVPDHQDQLVLFEGLHLLVQRSYVLMHQIQHPLDVRLKQLYQAHSASVRPCLHCQVLCQRQVHYVATHPLHAADHH